MRIKTDQVLRYAGVSSQFIQDHPQDALIQAAEKTALEMEKVLQPKTVWKVFEAQHLDQGIALKGTDLVLKGKLASSMLADSTHVIVMAATLGMMFEHLLSQKTARSMQEALLWDACGSDYVEKVLDELEQEIASKLTARQHLTDRFSCGYGDLPLSLQKEVSDLLNLPALGIFLTDSHMMVPSKSVTAFIGISPNVQKARIKGCAFCALKEKCPFRREGKTCQSD
ncbi:MAG: hypothetical protein HUJ54_10385 [Erysipelotrichaceae bacterium]|nr:hypothetical protein [Erysipelotrichaceae bacterium]